MRLTWIVLSSIFCVGCAASIVYNPMQVASQQELALNQSSFKAVQIGMGLDDVHKIMGQELLIGYQFQAPDYKPLTMPNPYKTEEIKGTSYFIEYYIEAIRQPDGIVHNDQLMPFVYKNGKLIGRGWPMADSVRLKQPST